MLPDLMPLQCSPLSLRVVLKHKLKQGGNQGQMPHRCRRWAGFTLHPIVPSLGGDMMQ